MPNSITKRHHLEREVIKIANRSYVIEGVDLTGKKLTDIKTHFGAEVLTFGCSGPAGLLEIPGVQLRKGFGDTVLELGKLYVSRWYRKNDDYLTIRRQHYGSKNPPDAYDVEIVSDSEKRQEKYVRGIEKILRK